MPTIIGPIQIFCLQVINSFIDPFVIAQWFLCTVCQTWAKAPLDIFIHCSFCQWFSRDPLEFWARRCVLVCVHDKIGMFWDVNFECWQKSSHQHTECCWTSKIQVRRQHALIFWMSTGTYWLSYQMFGTPSIPTKCTSFRACGNEIHCLLSQIKIKVIWMSINKRHVPDSLFSAKLLQTFPLHACQLGS